MDVPSSSPRSPCELPRPAGAAGTNLSTSGVAFSFASFFDPAPALHIALMLIESLREHMPAGAIGNEIEVVRMRRIGNGIERRPARIW